MLRVLILLRTYAHVYVATRDDEVTGTVREREKERDRRQEEMFRILDGGWADCSLISSGCARDEMRELYSLLKYNINGRALGAAARIDMRTHTNIAHIYIVRCPPPAALDGIAASAAQRRRLPQRRRRRFMHCTFVFVYMCVL